MAQPPRNKPSDPLVEKARPESGFAAASQAVAELIGNTRQHFVVCSESLPSKIFDTPPVLEAVRQFALKNARVSADLLVLQPRLVTSRPHPFVLACQQFPETFRLHSICRQMTPPAEDFLLNDGNQGLRFLQPGRSRFAWADGHSQAWLQGIFDELWRHSEPVPELRQFLL